MSRFAAGAPQRALLPLALLGIGPASGPAADAGSASLQLKNGARVEGVVLKENAQSLFVDLGYDVIAVPRDAIESMGAASTATLASGAAVPSTASGTEPAAPLAPAPAYASRSEMIDQSKRGVVIVSNPSGFGAGFLIDADGRVLTNHHVVRNQQYHAVTLLLRSPDGVLRRRKIENVELVAFSRLLDIALLQLPAAEIQDLDLRPLPLGDGAGLEIGDTVYAIGNPGMGRQMLDHTVSDGIISSSNRNIGDVLYLQTTAPVNPGNSGGPLLNAAGEVIGLVTLKAMFQENIAFALPANYIRLFLDNEKVFAFDKTNPNRAYRYLSPDWKDNARKD